MLDHSTQTSLSCVSTTNTAPTMFRRSFTTTVRLFHRSNGKPPAQEPNVPPAPHNEPKPNNNPKNDERPDVERPDIFETVKPRSKGFMFAFLNPEVPAEERSKSLLIFTITLFTAWATEPWMMPVQGRWFPTREEYLVDLVCERLPNKER
jgi:hypothetical protein